MAVTVIKHIGKALLSLGQPETAEDIDIVITDDLITAVGKGVGQETAADKVIDASGSLVHPGLVCSHHHFYSGLSRGIMADIGPTPDFISTLKQLWWRIDRALDEESIYLSSLICCLDAVRCGTTAVIDHHSSPSSIDGSLDAISRGFEKTGLRGMTCYEVTNRNRGEEEIEQGVAENVRFAEDVHRRQKAGERVMVRAAVGGHAPFTISDRGMRLLADAVSRTGCGVHLHVGEDRYDESISHHRYGRDLLERLDEFGLLDERSILVHGIFTSREDAELLNRRNAFLVHNARSNMNNHVGYNSRLSSCLNTALGTDGIGADMYEELKIAYFKNRDAGTMLQPEDYLQMLDRGNMLLSRHWKELDGRQVRFGRLEPGCKADLVISDYQSPTPFEAKNAAGHFAFGLGSAGVKTVIIDGRIALENRQFPFAVSSLYREAAAAAREVWERMNRIEA